MGAVFRWGLVTHRRCQRVSTVRRGSREVSSIARAEPEASGAAERGGPRQADESTTQGPGAGVRHFRAELPRAGPAPDDASRQRDRRATCGGACSGGDQGRQLKLCWSGAADEPKPWPKLALSGLAILRADL